MTNDGRWTYTWDAENRLTQMTSLESNPSGSKRKLDFAYDHQSRRIQKIGSTWTGSNYVSTATNKFIYDGWNLIAELNATNGLVRSYIWGMDLSGSMQGAGGVGGLLAVSSHTSPATCHFVCNDGNGNVRALIDVTNSAVSATYEYGPFGEPIRVPGTTSLNPFRFSTKYTDEETDLIYYGYRYYIPSTGRWLSRDPIDDFSFKASNQILTYKRRDEHTNVLKTEQSLATLT